MSEDTKIIYGKDDTTNVVSVELGDDVATLFIENKDGITTVDVPHERWILHKRRPSVGKCGILEGNRPFKYYSKHSTRGEFYQVKKDLVWKQFLTHTEDDMNFMVKSGVTMFKGMKLNEVSVLAFDIETNGLRHNDTSEVFLISNTLVKNGVTSRKLFRVDEFTGQREMIAEWCKWVRAIDPSVITGHNIFGFDLPYLHHCSVVGLKLGRNKSSMVIDAFVRKFRKDGSQAYEYNDCRIYGRNVIDTFFLSIKYDVARKYPSYKLKEIIDYEGLQKKDRQFYDASKIRSDWYNPKLREEICTYCKDDADDAIALYELMAPSFFYYTRSVPMGFQRVIATASGKQFNSILCRAYLQDARSLPEASDKVSFEGAIALGNPGVYKHVNKVDVASLYPSIILDKHIYNKEKDPDAYFYKSVKYFTEERLANKAKANETKDRYYRDLEQAQKIIINSAYGFMGAAGLCFNSPRDAAAVTREGRNILNRGIEWVNSSGYALVNLDTDSFSYSTGRKLTKRVFCEQIHTINSLFSDKIIWEDDGQFKTVLVVKTKNYVLQDYKGKISIKGSGLKATMKEPALRKFNKQLIDLLLAGKTVGIYKAYESLALEINRGIDINEWASKKTVTSSVLKPERTNESRILDAIGGKPVQEGDKIFVFFEELEKVTLAENFSGKYCKDKLFSKLFNTLKVFSTVIPIEMYPNYSKPSELCYLGDENEILDTPVVRTTKPSVTKKANKGKVTELRDKSSQVDKRLSANNTRIVRRNSQIKKDEW